MQNLTDDNFTSSVAEGLFLVDFYADWCGPCKMLSPILEETAPEYEGKIEFAKVNADDNPETAQKYNVMSLPTLVVFKDGAEIGRMVGFQSKDMLMQKLNEHVS